MMVVVRCFCVWVSAETPWDEVVLTFDFRAGWQVIDDRSCCLGWAVGCWWGRCTEVVARGGVWSDAVGLRGPSSDGATRSLPLSEVVLG